MKTFKENKKLNRSARKISREEVEKTKSLCQMSQYYFWLQFENLG